MNDAIPMEARAEHRFEPAALAAWLREAAPELGALRGVAQIEGGQSNPTYRLDCAAGAAALRKKPPGALLPSAHRIDREWRFLKALGAAPGVPVPRAIAWCEDDSLVGTPFYVMAWIDGSCFSTPLLDDLDAHARRKAYTAYFQALAALHAQDPMALGLADMGRAQGYVIRQIRRWSAQYDASRTRDVPVFDRLRQALAGWRPEEATPAIAHGDYRFANVIFTRDAERVAAILDWELATIGHPVADLAYTCSAFRCVPDTPGFPGTRGLEGADLGYPTERDALSIYRDAGGVAIPPDWNWWVAYGLFRLAAISQGVYRRGTEGKASSASWRRYGPAVDALARLGLEAIGE